MNDGITGILQEKLHQALPKILGKIINDYTEFANGITPGDAKNFAQHQTAGKSAATHLLALTKLVNWVEKYGAKHTTTTSDADFESLLRDARATLAAHNNDGSHDQEEDKL